MNGWLRRMRILRAALRSRLTLAGCKVGLDRPLIPTAFVANSVRSARASRPRRSADRGSPGDEPTGGDWETCGRGGRAGQDTVPEPAWRRQPQVAAMGQSDALPRTPHRQGSVSRQRFSVKPRGLGRVGDECSFLTWGLRHQTTARRPIRVLVARARSESSKGPRR